MKKLEMWAVINTKWKEYGWKDCFYEQMLAIRGENIFGAAIFTTKEEAKKFKKVGNKRKEDNIVKIRIII